ncbi:MAG TPA: aminotransferase class I/II-fold pyridoxal phosphate-dependent enzyme [Bacteroidales bacterium]|jgi:cystathionine beta-lyase|nr:aminotransferase class I/II-fold pyridoxal phosphate-dependent enzyme [Bacteroidales bacterium]
MSNSKHTVCIHEGQHIGEFGGINTPIYTSTSYGYLDTDERLYPRYFNIPNQLAVIEKVAKLEGADTGLVFSSGMAAISSVIFGLLKKGDHCVFQKGLYGGTMHFITDELEKFGIEYTVTENNDPGTFERAIRKNTKVVYVESPSNPLLSITDLERVGRICRAQNCISVIDNTFASPINQNPIKFGIDIVLHSATKYLGGHSDICAGVVLSNSNLIDTIRNTALSLGGSLNALMCYLLERSIKTMAVRVDKQNINAGIVADYLNNQKNISAVYYPGLKNHPGHDIAARQMLGFGGMLSFELTGQDITSFQKRLKLIRPAMSLGGVESIICAPVTTSHRLVSKEQREKEGIRDNLLRLSVGIESHEDLIADLQQALQSH